MYICTSCMHYLSVLLCPITLCVLGILNCIYNSLTLSDRLLYITAGNPLRQTNFTYLTDYTACIHNYVHVYISMYVCDRNCMWHLRGYMQGKEAHNSTSPQQPFFQRKKSCPWVGFEPTTLCSLGMSALPTELPGQLSK